MPRILELLHSRLRAIGRSDWEESTGLRWAGQIVAGILPGLVVLGIIMHFSAQTGSTVGGRGRSAASVVPLLSAAAIADTAAFHRQQTVNMPARSAEFRHPRMVETLPSAVPVAAPVALAMDFHAPRVAWHYLTPSLRRSMDAGVASNGAPLTSQPQIVLHGSGQARGSLALLDRYQASVHGFGAGTAYDFIIGNAQSAGDGVVEVSPRWSAASANDGAGNIHICLIGDFQRVPPTPAQLAALDEVLDYLSLKLGRLPVTVHGDGRCLGAKFPAEQVIDATKD